ncbi:putative metalloendopeptidase Ecym_3301 [Eremothecium cymbalariae DBVPG|uniref:Jacalin-type lectin domain-containing protein n=1 Tax=Eremothecium cymbalariae (strain CBS 270.75 / DBVPG 7215 / KCTC 17166 / NRRL Y-17582) TaxID=931890 RepID=G8JRM4_ERECY|nr:Hypothetical protein Ecym_3301 [Eremothecium cymbalariae DBVPG\
MECIEIYNLVDGYEVHCPALIIHGRCRSSGATAIQVQHSQLPSLTYAVNRHGFKALIYLTRGKNALQFVTNENEQISLTCSYEPLLQNPPIHLCLLLASDSPMVFDSPASQKAKEGGNGMDLAVKKLRCAARLMQAFTNEQMLRNGFGHRTFRFEEEETEDTLLQVPERRPTVKVHIVRTNLTTAQIRDPNLAQQNPKGNNTGGLFGIAMDALKAYGGPFSGNTDAVQAAVIIMDTYWDAKQRLIKAHAALGGGDSKIKLAIFGSHGLYSWPPCIEAVPSYFTDSTPVSESEVANDCNECSSHWECLNITLGAFMHEIGHLLGCPHQESGVMLRDYVTLNRSFLSKEAFSVRTRNHGAESPILPQYECTWHRLDLIRFLHHPSFALPSDNADNSSINPTRLANFEAPKPSLYLCGNNGQIVFVSQTGIYCIEIVCEEIARAHIEFLPYSLGGPGPQRQVFVSLDDLTSRLPPNYRSQHSKNFKVKVHAVNSESADFDDFPSRLKVSLIPMSRYGYPSTVNGIKGQLFGSGSSGSDLGIVPVYVSLVQWVRVFHGYALDGIRFYFRPTLEPELEETGSTRNYLKKIKDSIKSPNTLKSKSSVLFGNETPNFTDFVLDINEYIVGFNVRSGVWVDAIQIITSSGRTSPMLGNTTGGGLGMMMPYQGDSILGLYGNIGSWINAIGIVYGKL